MTKHLLIIDDEPGHRLMVRAVMEDDGWQVSEAGSGEEGVSLFTAGPQAYQVVLVDMKMPGMDGQATLHALHAIRPETPVVMLTAYGTVGAAVEAMKHGAFDYLTKPADNDELALTLNRAFSFSQLTRENEQLLAKVAGQEVEKSIVGSSAAITRLHTFIQQAGPSEATVLICGESGTGKELIAEALHKASLRSKNPLIKVNCAALPAQLLESELFGYEKGAFTGAVRDKPGRFQLAAGGTLFLDEIGEIPMDLQAKLLRVLQDRKVEPLGSVRTIPVDVRILAATNRNLRQAVAAGEFREDLYFRLNVLEVVSPPLRQRLDDIPRLAHHLLGRLAEKNRKNIRGISQNFLAALCRYAWPGNVRELENVLERALILSRSDVLHPDSLPQHVLAAPQAVQAPAVQAPGIVQPQTTAAAGTAGSQAGQGTAVSAALPAQPVAPAMQGDTPTGAYSPELPLPEGMGAGSLLEQAERETLLHALEYYQGHREKTAESLGISRRTLQYKLKKYGLIRR